MKSPGSAARRSPNHFMRLRLFIDFWNFSLNWIPKLLH